MEVGNLNKTSDITHAATDSHRLPLLYPLILGIAGLLVLGMTSMLTGAGFVDAKQSLNYLIGDPQAKENAHLAMVMETLRGPRTIIAILVGVALGVSATLMQNLTRNPLADPGLLGVNAGAALGVVFGISFAQAENAMSYLIWAILGASLANIIVLIVAQTRKNTSPLRLILAGMAITATFVALTNFLLLSFVNSLDQFQYWTMGSLSGGQMELIYWMAPVIILGLILTAVFTRPLSVMLLGDQSALSLGFDPRVIRWKIVVVTTILTASSVAMVGPIGFLGLIAAYLARGLVGASIARQVVFSAIIGALVLLAADILSRVIARPFETPVSVLTAILGAPLLIWIVRSNRLLSITSQ
ncbi:FecCD family ABC transporter permease [Aliikangiella coralliicola]|uniref:Iron ABC transporter permease n=1 Tax=Aliikangiella coralliicola TaxID=2592383 RepID=A0A545UCF6_9GAMM|nr:iron ABC transporter permease [Aliikangiella coralliicola]TQV87103.1 iron ABC transporter permease [Aliikangiella coralliicola]